MPDWTWTNNSVFSFWNDPLSHAVGGVGYKTDINKTYTNAATAVVHMFHGGLWGGWSFQVSEQDTATQSLLFSHGGYQEARGAGGGKHYFIENVLEVRRPRCCATVEALLAVSPFSEARGRPQHSVDRLSSLPLQAAPLSLNS